VVCLSQRTALLNYLPKSTNDLTLNEQIKLNAILLSNEHIAYDVATVNPENTVFIDRSIDINFTTGLLQGTHLGSANLNVNFVVDYVDTQIDGTYYWMGNTIEGHTGSATISKHSNDLYTGKLNFENDLIFQILPLGPEKVVVIRIDPTKLPLAGCTTPAGDINDLGSDDDLDLEPRGNCPTRKVRILFLFTNRAGAPSNTSPFLVAQNVINELNVSSNASKMFHWEVFYELANTVNLGSFVESLEIGPDLNRLVDNTTAQTFRANNLADLVVLFTDSPGYNNNGRAKDIKTNFESAYSIADIDVSENSFTASHEIGHMMSARHQRCTECGGGFLGLTSGCDEIGRGHGVGLGDFHTIMFQRRRCGKMRTGRWSNPDADFMGSPTGDWWRNNARSITNHASTVACFFPEPVVINTSMMVNILGPGFTSCGGGLWTANIFNNTGSEPYTYIWEISESGVSNWSLVGGNTESVTEEDITSSFGYGQWENFTLRVRVRDNSSPQLSASKSKNIGHVYCLQGSNETSARSSNNNVKIAYPNPATTFLYYSFEASPTIQIFDNSGRNIKCNYEQINDKEILINISNLAKGVYYISELENTKSKIKFIKI
jgi:hypothetical protein